MILKKNREYWIAQYDIVFNKFCMVYRTDDYILQAILIDQLKSINNKILSFDKKRR